MKHWLRAWGVLLVILGCSAVGPPRVENGRYIHPVCQFSLGVPAGWDVSDEVPASLKKDMSWVASRKFKATFYDLKNRRFILVAADNTETDWVSFKMYSDKFTEALREFYAGEKRKFLKKSGWKDYRYDIYEDRIEACTGSCIAVKVLLHALDNMATGYTILYESRYGTANSVSVILVSRERQHADGLTVLKQVVDSFQRH